MDDQTRSTVRPFLLTAAFFLLAVGPTRLAVGADNRTEVIPHWVKGATARYVVTKTRVRGKEGAEALNATSRTDLLIEVLDKTTEGYLVAWTYGETTFLDPGQQRNPLVNELGNLIKGQRIVFDMDKFAVIKGVRNWEELQVARTKAIDATMKVLAAARVDQTDIERVRAQTVAMFSTREQAERVYLREAHVFFMAHGATLSLTKPLEYEDSLQSPFGGETVPTRARFALKATDLASDEVTITWQQTARPEQLHRGIEETAGVAVTERSPNLKDLKMVDRAEFVLEMSTGWVRSLSHTRRISFGGIYQQDDTTIVKQKSD